MNEKSTDPNNTPDLPDDLDGLPDEEPADSPPAIQDPSDPDAHGPLIQA